MAKKKAHQHAEAFSLMHYQCQSCEHREVFWNARDGVVPFVTSCPDCGKDMLHVDWDQDEYAPEYIPSIGQGIWIDTPQELVPVLIRLTLQIYREEAEEEPPPGLEEAIASQYQLGSPWLLRWEEY